MGLKRDKLERARKAGVLITAARGNKKIDRDFLFNYIQAHLSYGSIDLDDFAQVFFVERGIALPEGVDIDGAF